MNDVDQPLPPAPRPASPWRPLLIWTGPVFALTNASLFPLVSVIVAIALAGMLVAVSPGSPPPAPPPAKSWLPVLSLLFGCGLALVPAQALLATVCLILGPGSFWRRLSIYWLVVLAALLSILAGVPIFWIGGLIVAWFEGRLDFALQQPFFSTGDQPLGEQIQQALAIPCALPMILLGAQAPFWGLRLLGGRRLERMGTENGPTESLAIKDLLLATALVAASLTLLQFSDRVFTDEANAALSFLFGTLIVAGVTLAASLLAGVPLACLFFSRYSLALCWGGALFATGFCSVVVFAIGSALTPTSDPLEQFCTICLLAYCYVTAAATGLTVLRRSGWQLTRRNMRYSETR
jgi:hypothetical protein